MWPGVRLVLVEISGILRVGWKSGDDQGCPDDPMCIARAMPKSRIGARYRQAIERAAVSPTTTISARLTRGTKTAAKEGGLCARPRHRNESGRLHQASMCSEAKQVPAERGVAAGR
jgi:hypothetical protein